MRRRTTRQRQKTWEYRTDREIIDWLQEKFEFYADGVTDAKKIGRISKSEIMHEAEQDKIDPYALKCVVDKYQQFGTTGEEYWFTTKKPRVPIYIEREPEESSSKSSEGGAFARLFADHDRQLKPLTEKQERSVMAQSKKMIAALED